MNYKLLAATPLLIAGFAIHQNKYLKTRKLKLQFDELPTSFNNFKIAHVSDIHCDKIGFSDFYFINQLKNFEPDIIVITGDMLDSYKNDMDIVYNILSQMSAISRCYFVSGNHELRLHDEYNKLKTMLDKLGIVNLNNKNEFIVRGNDKINICGVEDYNFFKKDKVNHKENFQKLLTDLYKNNFFNILLAHRPEKFEHYYKANFNLTFSGHAHGGQWRLPFVGGIFSPSQGFFPKYSHGVYKEKKSTLVVSQGLGNSSFPIRFNNRIELVLVTLTKN